MEAAPALPVAPAAIILPTPISVVSKLTVVLIVFGLYVGGLLFYTLSTDNYRFNGRMLWQFLMEQNTEHQVPAKVDRIRSLIHRKASDVAAKTETDVSQLPPIPVPTPTMAAVRDMDPGEDTFVGDRRSVGTKGTAEAFGTLTTSSSSSSSGWWQGIIDRIRQMWSKAMTRMHVRGKTFYARKVLV
jgi:hypothetical protein